MISLIHLQIHNHVNGIQLYCVFLFQVHLWNLYHLFSLFIIFLTILFFSLLEINLLARYHSRLHHDKILFLLQFLQLYFLAFNLSLLNFKHHLYLSYLIYFLARLLVLLHSLFKNCLHLHLLFLFLLNFLYHHLK